ERPVDQRSDIYSLGVVLFEMTTGRRPYQARDPIELISALSRPIPRVDEGHPEIPRELADVIAKALAVERSARYESAAAIDEALGAFKRKLERKPFAWPGWLQAVGVAVLATLIALALVLSLRMRQQTSSSSPPATTGSVVAVLPLENLSGDPA